MVTLVISSWALTFLAGGLAWTWRREAHAATSLAERRLRHRRESEARLEALAAVDGLTGLSNHRSFHDRLAGETARAERHERNLSVAILDVDHFKQINDRFGHPAGDRVLTETAERLRGLVRNGEHLARVGGEEFALVLPDVDGVGAFAAAERIRRAIASTPYEGVGSVTLSAGVCDLVTAGSAGELYRLADRALYWSKAHGRNLTFRYTPEVADELEHRSATSEVQRPDTIANLRALVALVADRHPSTQHHAERVAAIAHALALEAGWDPERAHRLRDAALVHDVGKIALREEVLFKHGPLDQGDLAHIRTHPLIGARIAARALDPEQASWVRCHHERWDGTGYPAGLRGATIPDGAQLLGLADAWDAMTSDRWYRAARDHEQALTEIARQAGLHFAPDAARRLVELAESGRLGRIAGAH